jgi:hypothetical protein
MQPPRARRATADAGAQGPGAGEEEESAAVGRTEIVERDRQDGRGGVHGSKRTHAAHVHEVFMPTLLANAAVDPFDALPIEMPLGSKQLLQYCMARLILPSNALHVADSFAGL